MVCIRSSTLPVSFNSILTANGINPSEVRLIRHKDTRASRGFGPYELWRDYREKFDLYQSNQSLHNRVKLSSKFWAVFLGTPSKETMFVGIYESKYLGLNQEGFYEPHVPDEFTLPQTCDTYELKLCEELADLAGKLFIEWGQGALAWIQYADRNDKKVSELRREFREEEFPGYLNFVEPLSRMNSLPIGWQAALKLANGIYLLTCPQTREQYVGSAYGGLGFWGRWQEYITNGHGGNVALKSRDLSDYQVAILEVAGSTASVEEIIAKESLWKRKFQSKDMGLNRN
jgi:hypothetical protein